MKPGDVFMLNDPYHGGTHLPDITVVTPVFADPGAGAPGSILFFVASRGHHAEIGGITPGSMPAFSTRVDEEGVLIDNWRLAGGGELREAATTDLLTSAEFPSRNPGANLADLRAQIAANEKGVAELGQLVREFGLDVVTAYMGHVQDNAEEAVRRVIARLHDGECAYELDNGAVIKVAVRVDQQARTARIDFTGTSAQLPGNFNAPSSVAMAAVLYVLRTLVDDEIPLNAGCLKPVRVIIPPGSLLAPAYPAAVAAGNVETSQAVTGALYAALGVMAEGSGTMNNVTFGNGEYQYYETVASGSGAGDGFGGASVVQTHMTNSRLTDPEVLEWRFPVRLESFEIRRGSGGAGRWPGGDGGRRRLRFLAPMTVSTLSSHRRVPPYGMAGGAPGQLGDQWVERADGSVTGLAGCDRAELEPGDVFVLETPGGGGYGPPLNGTGSASGSMSSVSGSAGSGASGSRSGRSAASTRASSSSIAVGRLGHDLVGLQLLVLVEELLHERDVHRLEERSHLERGQHLLEHLHRPGARRHAAVAGEPGRLVVPLVVQVVDRVLGGRVEPVVVLRDHEDERVRPADGGAPVLGVLVLILLQPRMPGLVEHRQVDLGQVHHLDREVTVRLARWR